jgi:predicted RND superfamily exporter protein
MSKDFEEKVLNKLDELDRKVSCIDEMKEKISRIDAIEEKISCIDEIKEKVSKIDEIEKIALANGRKIDHLDYRVGRIEGSLILMERQLNDDLKAIHEGHMLNTELRIEDRKRIDSLEKQDFDYAARISNLEFAIEKNSEQIKN